MEPLTTAAMPTASFANAINSIIATKVLEKTSKKVGKALLDKTGKFLITLSFTLQEPRAVQRSQTSLHPSLGNVRSHACDSYHKTSKPYLTQVGNESIYPTHKLANIT